MASHVRRIEGTVSLPFDIWFDDVALGRSYETRLEAGPMRVTLPRLPGNPEAPDVIVGTPFPDHPPMGQILGSDYWGAGGTTKRIPGGNGLSRAVGAVTVEIETDAFPGKELWSMAHPLGGQLNDGAGTDTRPARSSDASVGRAQTY